MNGLYYFNHDDKAHRDLKIIKLRRKYGMEGYGVYWLLLEIMHDNNGCINEDDDLEAIACYEQIDEEWLEEFIDFCVDIDLFEREKNYIYSERMLDEINNYLINIENGKKGANARWNESEDSGYKGGLLGGGNSKRKEKKKEEKNKIKKTTTNKTKKECNKKNDDVVVAVASSEKDFVKNKNEIENKNLIADDDVVVASSENVVVEKTNQIDNNNLIDDTVFSDNVFSEEKVDDIIEQSTQLMKSFMDEQGLIRFTLVNELGVNENVANDFIKAYPTSYLQEKINDCKTMIKQKQIKTSPAQWIVQAIKNNYSTSKPIVDNSTSKIESLSSVYVSFKKHYFKTFSQEFNDMNKSRYDQALHILQVPSKIDFLLTCIDENPNILTLIKNKHHITRFEDILGNEVMMNDLINFYRGVA